MDSNKIRRLPVIDATGKMCGMGSLGDLALNLDNTMVGELLAELSK